MSDYKDRWITVDGTGISVRGYYFPVGSKRIPFEAIRSVSRVNMGALTGKARIWGTANLSYWASLDPGRPRKQIAFLVDNGKPVKPFLTPDDPQAFEAALSSHGQVTAQHGGRSVLI
jgi:hypothetical protein